MSLPIEDLTPREIVAELDRYIVGQAEAKRAVAVALRNRYRRQQLAPDERDDVLPKNILMIGPTGVGKTEIARRLAQLARAPMVKVEATKFTEVGYVGRDVESMIRDLAGVAVRLVEREKVEQVRPIAEKRAVDQLVRLLEPKLAPAPKREPEPAEEPETVEIEGMSIDTKNPLLRKAMEVFGSPFEPFEANDAPKDDAREQRLSTLREAIERGDHDHEEVEIETEESSNPFVQVFTPQGMEEMGLDMNNLANPFQSRRNRRKVSVGEARRILADEEAQKQIDRSALHREAVLRTEQTGIVFLDELDKVAGKQGGSGPDVSREGVQRDLLPIIEGSTVATKFGPVRTDHILFIAAGAFHMSKPSDLIPELQGRLPIRVELDSLSQEDFRRILREPQNALTKQYSKLLAVEGVELDFTDDALDALATLAVEVNSKTENIGARRLHTLLEKLLEEVLFQAPDVAEKRVTFDGSAVRARLEGLVGDADLSRYIL